MLPRNPDEDLLEGKKISRNDPRSPLVQALRIGLYDEMRAHGFYSKVMEQYGPVPPFVNIARSETNHMNAMTGLCRRYGVMPPINDWASKLTLPSSFGECCEVGVEAEIENGAMYDGFLSHPMPLDAVNVFRNLRSASWDNHLTAFQRCAASQSASILSNSGGNKSFLVGALMGVAAVGLLSAGWRSWSKSA